MKYFIKIGFIFFINVCFFTNNMLAADFADSMVDDYYSFHEIFEEELPNNIQEQKVNKKSKYKRLKPKKAKKSKKDNNSANNSNEFDIQSDYMQYYPERKEIEAIGNASIKLRSNGALLKADKMVLNQETAILKGYGNVRLINGSYIMEGDFVRIDLDQDNALLDNPMTETETLKLKAKIGRIQDEEIIMEDGDLKITEDKTISLGVTSFANFGMSNLAETQKVFYLKEAYNQNYRITSDEVIIDGKEGHDVVYAKNAKLYLKSINLDGMNNLKLITDKEQQYVETNMPEFGFIRQVGTYIGPGWATQAPFNGAFKIAPFLNIYEGDVGVGGLLRYRNSKNITEIAAASTRDSKIVARGSQELAENLDLEYGANSYNSEWFLGDRLSEKLIQLRYHKRYNLENIGTSFEQHFTAALASEYDRSHWTTTRFRWQAQADKPLVYYADDNRNFYASFDLSTQTAATVYGSGDTHGLLRFGPRLRTETNNWIQTLGYYYTAQQGDTPFTFDKYMYGTNNVYLTEGLKLNRYLSLMWSGSLAINKDAWDGKFLQENRFYVLIGPDDVKFTLGYDSVRKRALFSCLFTIGTKNSQIEYKKLRIKNVKELGKSDEKDEEKNKQENNNEKNEENTTVI